MIEDSIQINNNVMLISFTGAQSSGKTTLLRRAQVDPEFRKWNFIPEVTRVVKRLGFEINELGTSETQLFILAEHLRNHYIKTDTMLDRCIVDGLVYTQYLASKGAVDKWVYHHAQNLYEMMIDKLDIIFYTDHNIPVEDDGERSVDIDFRNEIIKVFEQTMNRPDTCNKIVQLKGDTCFRYKTLKQTIRQHDKAR